MLVRLESAANDHIIAAVSHPYFKLQWIPSEHVEKCRLLFARTRVVICSNILQPQSSSCSNDISPDDDFFTFFYSTWVIENDTNADNKLQLEYAYYLKDTDVHIWSVACGTSIRMLYKCSSGTIRQQSNACSVSEDSFTLRKVIVLLTIRLRLLLLIANATEGSSSK